MTSMSPTQRSTDLDTAARATTVLWLGVSVITFVVWLAVCIIGGSIDSPWFLWTFVAGGLLTGGVRLATRTCRSAR